MDDNNTLEITEESPESEEVTIAPALQGKSYAEGVGRRKTSTARVRVVNNTDKTVMNIIVNDSGYTNYFPSAYLQKMADAPLRKLRIFEAYKITAQVSGGGPRGQAEAIRLGLARALLKVSPDWRQRLKKAGFLTRDARTVERKKYGLRKARRAPQWSKR